jgi:hypothetical protein
MPRTSVWEHNQKVHDAAEGFESIHTRHFDVEGDDIGIEFCDLAESFGTAAGRAGDLEARF